MATIFEDARRKRQEQIDAAEKGEEVPKKAAAPAPAPAPFDFFKVNENDPEVKAARARATQRYLRDSERSK